MSLSTAVRPYYSTDTGAPVLNRAVGSLITVLDAVLVNGYNVKAVQAINRSDMTATLLTSVTHGFNVHDVIKIAGANEPDFNGEFRVLTVPNATSLTFEIPNTVPSVASGTMDVRKASLGWEKVYSAMNKAVYRSGDLLSTRQYLRVDDSVDAYYAKTQAFGSMTDIDTGTAPFPLDAQMGARYGWAKACSGDSHRATNLQWSIIGDARFFYYMVDGFYYESAGLTTPTVVGHAFGDYCIGPQNIDPRPCLLAGCLDQYAYTGSKPNAYGQILTFVASPSTLGSGAIGGAYLATSMDGTPIIPKSYVNVWNSPYMIAGETGYVVTNNPFDMSQVFQYPAILSDGNSHFRGWLPGVYIPQGTTATTTHLAKEFLNGDTTKVMQFFKTVKDNTGQSYGSLANRGCVAFDIIGPWR